jgi:hypothetical protein
LDHTKSRTVARATHDFGTVASRMETPMIPRRKSAVKLDQIQKLVTEVTGDSSLREKIKKLATCLLEQNNYKDIRKLFRKYDTGYFTSSCVSGSYISSTGFMAISKSRNSELFWTILDYLTSI